MLLLLWARTGDSPEVERAHVTRWVEIRSHSARRGRGGLAPRPV